MSEALVWTTVAVCFVAAILAYDRTRDVFHPAMFIAPMLAFLYGWIPYRVARQGFIDQMFFSPDQVRYVQWVNLAGVFALLSGLLLATRRVRKFGLEQIPVRASDALMIGGGMLGAIGMGCWLAMILNSGGFEQAFGKAYYGGWDDSGYIRDGQMLLVPAILLELAATNCVKKRLSPYVLAIIFATPYAMQALLTARRGPTFTLVVIVAMGWYLHRRRRPLLAAALAGGFALGLLVLLLVANRGAIFIGSQRELTMDVGALVEKPDPGNEFIYGTGSLLTSKALNKHYWGKRYATVMFVRPIPSAIWPDKYDDIGLTELKYNAGTGGEIGDFGTVLGWEGAPGSAPGIVADMFLEVSWLAFPALFITGWLYTMAWMKAVELGNGWVTLYAILAALSIYLVMQTVEAVLFRLLLLGVPSALVWMGAQRAMRHRGVMTA